MQRFISPERPMGGGGCYDGRDSVTELGDNIRFPFSLDFSKKVHFFKYFSYPHLIITKYNNIINNISCNLEDYMNKFTFTFAQSATHFAMFRNFRKSAFTLAEVLITLGIIGVVAALTIPTLIGKYEIYVRQQQFKKAYSEIETALQKAQYDLGGFPKCYYGVDSDATQGFKWDECPLLFDTIANNFKTVKKCENNALANGCLPPGSYKGGEKVFVENNPDKTENDYGTGCTGFKTSNIEQLATAYVLNDGIIIFSFSYASGGKTAFAPLAAIDVNGKKGPNKWGHDVFAFSFSKENKTTGIRILPMANSCQPVEKGGKTAYDYWYLMNKGITKF